MTYIYKSYVIFMNQIAFYYPENLKFDFPLVDLPSNCSITRVLDIKGLIKFTLAYKGALILLILPSLTPEIKSIINAQSKDSFFVHIGEANSSLEAWSLHLFHFIPLPLTLGDLKDAYTYFLKKTNRENKVFTYSDTQGVHNLDLESIFYFKAEGNYSYLKLKAGKHLVVTKQIGQIESSLPSEFVRVNRSWIFNFNLIKSLDKDSLELADGQKLPITGNMFKLIKNIMRKKSLV